MSAGELSFSTSVTQHAVEWQFGQRWLLEFWFQNGLLILISHSRPRMDLSPSTSYQRLLVHRCSAYYKLSPESDPGSKGIVVLLTQASRM